MIVGYVLQKMREFNQKSMVALSAMQFYHMKFGPTYRAYVHVTAK